MKRFYLYTLLVTTLILGSCNSDDNDYVAVDDDDPIVLPLIFENILSEMGVFTGPLESLTPAEGLHLFDLNTGLFTDYARKQRLLRLPEGTAMQYNNSDLLPTFPDNTLISKTFYYYIDDRDPSLGKKIIETRIIIKVEGEWKLGNYIWNEAQTEATYTNFGSIVPISYIDIEGDTQNIDYGIPSQENCITCHNINKVIWPIGPKLRNMNFNPQNGTINQNQLDYFINNGLLEGISNPSSIGILADWTDETAFDIFERGRAYIDINCAHCHRPGGIVPTGFLLDFRLETPFKDTGIREHRGQIEDRIQSNVPVYMMPQLGRSIVHQEAVDMLLIYLEAIE